LYSYFNTDKGGHSINFIELVSELNQE